MVKEKQQESGQEPEFEKEEMANKSRKEKKPRADKQKERARPADADSSEPSTIFYMHSLLLFGGRLLHRVLGFYNSLFELTPADQAKIYRNLSNHYVRKGLHERALDYLREWARLDASNPDSHFHLGIGLASFGNFKGAIRAFDRVLKLAPNHKKALYRKSGICLKLKDYPGAVETLKQLIDAVPDNAKAYYLLGIAYDRMDEVDPAVDAMKKATELDPEEIKYYQHLGFLYERKEDHTQAAKCFSKVMELQREQDEEE
jgi:superkiller protein 3